MKAEQLPQIFMQRQTQGSYRVNVGDLELRLPDLDDISVPATTEQGQSYLQTTDNTQATKAPVESTIAYRSSYLIEFDSKYQLEAMPDENSQTLQQLWQATGKDEAQFWFVNGQGSEAQRPENDASDAHALSGLSLNTGYVSPLQDNAARFVLVEVL